MADFQPALPFPELPPGASRKVRLAGRVIALWNTGQAIFATDDLCTHERASLSEGDFDPDAGIVACPKHGARFDLRTGKALTLPAHRPLRTYPVEVRDGQIAVKLDP